MRSGIRVLRKHAVVPLMYRNQLINLTNFLDESALSIDMIFSGKYKKKMWFVVENWISHIVLAILPVASISVHILYSNLSMNALYCISKNSEAFGLKNYVAP